ncbi:MAG TPA: hypothetical protein VIZ90_17380 [Rhizobiaceae bacterium]
MRIILTVAALVVFAVSTGLLEMGKSRHGPFALPPAMSTFQPAAWDPMVTSSITPYRLDER